MSLIDIHRWADGVDRSFERRCVSDGRLSPATCLLAHTVGVCVFVTTLSAVWVLQERVIACPHNACAGLAGRRAWCGFCKQRILQCQDHGQVHHDSTHSHGALWLEARQHGGRIQATYTRTRDEHFVPKPSQVRVFFQQRPSWLLVCVTPSMCLQVHSTCIFEASVCR